MIPVYAGQPVNQTQASSTPVWTGPCVLIGFLVATTTNGTMVFNDALVTGGPVLNGAITPAAGKFYEMHATFATGIFVDYANSINVTFVVQALNQPIALTRNG